MREDVSTWLDGLLEPSQTYSSCLLEAGLGDSQHQYPLEMEAIPLKGPDCKTGAGFRAGLSIGDLRGKFIFPVFVSYRSFPYYTSPPKRK